MSVRADRRHRYRKQHRLRQLRAFCLAARLKSFSRAGERLGKFQPAVSLHVRELEKELETVLFERSSSGVTLTPAGEHLYKLAEPLVRGIDNLPADLIDPADERGPNRLRIAASVAAAAIVLPRYVKRFRDEHPEIRILVRNCQLGEGLKLLLGDTVEFVLGASDAFPEDAVEYIDLLSYEIVLITSEDHPLAGRASVVPEETRAWPAIVPPPGAYSTLFGPTAAQQFGMHENAAITVEGWGVIKRYVERGAGIAVVPSISIQETDRVSVIPLREYFPSRSFGVYTRRGAYLTPPARRLLGMMGARLRPPRLPPAERLGWAAR